MKNVLDPPVALKDLPITVQLCLKKSQEDTQAEKGRKYRGKEKKEKGESAIKDNSHLSLIVMKS